MVFFILVIWNRWEKLTLKFSGDIKGFSYANQKKLIRANSYDQSKNVKMWITFYGKACQNLTTVQK
jgi:hypothetical protein